MCYCPVLIIDDAQKDVDKKIIMEFTFVQPVMSVRLRMDRYGNAHSHCMWSRLAQYYKLLSKPK